MAKIKITSNNMVEIPIQPHESMTERKIYNRVRKYEELKAQIDELTTQMDKLKAELIGDAVAIDDHAKRYTLIYKTTHYKTLDTKRLKTEMPDIYAAYQKDATKPYFKAVTT